MKSFLLLLIGSAIITIVGTRFQATDGVTYASQSRSAITTAPEFHVASAFGLSREVRRFARSNRSKLEPFRLRAEALPDREPRSETAGKQDSDGAIFRSLLSPMPPASLSFAGLSNFDNIDAYGLVIIPPDISGDIGPGHYVQAVNALVRVFDRSGAAVSPPFKMSELFSPLGTPCSARDDGDPMVAYDPLADRWLLSQYCTNFPPFRQMVAISQTADPTGAYYVYEFVMPNVRIHDFPKFGVWPDAYYMSTEEFLGSDYAGAGLFAFDRAKMLAGDPAAGYVYFNKPSNSTVRRSNFLPADLDGLRPPPAGAANVFVSYTATEYGDAADAVRLFEFRPDFQNPANSTFAERPESPLAVAAFDPTSPDGRADITQPAPGERLDSNSDRINYRVAYRNFGGTESLVFNQTVRIPDPSGAYRAGVRVYELRRPAGGVFTVSEHSTIGSPGASRWIGNVAQDHLGDLAVSYNSVTDEKPPGIRYSGRLASEPAGTFRQESDLIDGTGVQKAFGWRWGDYAALNVDPVDDCTFWATGEYYTLESQQVSDFTWLSRIGTFKFPECTPAPRSYIGGVVTDAATGLPVPGASISAAEFSRGTSPAGSFGPMMLLPGSYALTASANGYVPQTVNVSVNAGQTLTQNFTLQSVPVIEVAGAALTTESCGVNGSPEPGETVTYGVSLRNSGALDASDLTATLLPSGGVTSPTGPVSFGPVVHGGAAVTRNFTFTVDSAIACGTLLTLTLELKDGGRSVGTVVLPLQTGSPRIALRESFDRTPQARLPLRWTSSATGPDGLFDRSRSWRVSPRRSVSSLKSAFAPDLGQVGVGEMVSPVFAVRTAEARLTFSNWYDLETTFLRNRLYDGSALEIRIGAGQWQDIVAAGGQFESGGYDGTIDTCCGNPLGGRSGWSGRSGINADPEFIISRVRLPAAAAGQMVQLRWRLATDVGTSREGQYIDDVFITDGFSCGCTGQ